MSIASKRLYFTNLFVFSLWIVAYAAETMPLVKERSRIEFAGTKPGWVHRGGFKQFTVDAAVDLGDLAKSTFKIDIDANSLWSDNNGLTSHLKNADFFDVSRFQNITLEATRIELRGATKVVVNGTLTLLGKTVEIAVPCDVEISEGSVQSKCEFKISRSQWGMNYGKGRVDDEVEVTARFLLGR